MRLLVYLQSNANTVYDTSYHHKLRGRIWRALEDTPFEEEHDSHEPPGIAFSNIFPWGDIEEGDERKMLVASPKEELLSYVAQDLKRNPEFNVGEMSFTVEDMSALDTDVGEPGTSGVIETATGVVVRLYEKHRKKYGINADGIDEDEDNPTYWSPEHTTKPFIDAVTENLQNKHDVFEAEHLPGPMEVDGDLFTGFELIKTYALPVTVTQGVEIEMVLSKWRLTFDIRDNHHRRHLNLALDTGIGGRNSLGFGFVNIVEKNRAGRNRATT